MPEQVVGRSRQDRIEHCIGLRAEAIVAGQHGKANEVLRDQAVVIRDRVVDRGMRADDETFRVGGGEEVSAMLGVGVIPIECALPFDGLGEPGALACRLVQGDGGAVKGLLILVEH